MPEAPPKLTFQYESECGSPLTESALWDSLEGSVIKVIDCNTVLLSCDHGPKKLRVHLAAAHSPTGSEPLSREALEKLKSLCLNKHAEILFRLGLQPKREVTAVLYVGTVDVAFAMIELGLSRHVDPAPYTLSNHTDCTYRVIEREAKRKAIGIWR